MPFIFNLEVVPGSTHMPWERGHDKIICRIKESGESAHLNREIIAKISEALGLPHSKVEIVHGADNYKKMLKVTDYKATLDMLIKGLGLEK